MNKLITPLLLVGLGACITPPEPEIPFQGIVLTELENSSRLPANVTLFFKADYANGDPISDLNIADIDIYEDDALISAFEADRDFLRDPEQFRFTTLLVLDLSGSVLESEALPVLKSSAQQFINKVMGEVDRGSTEMAIYWFDGETNLHQLQEFTTDVNLLLNKVESITPGISQDNSTNLYGAVVQSVDLMENRMQALQGTDEILTAGSIMLFTDGTDRAGRVSKTEAMNKVQARSENLTLLSLGLGAEIDQPTLEGVGRNGFAFAEDLNELTNTFSQIADKMSAEANSFYIFQYCSPKRAGDFTLRIDARKNEQMGSLASTYSADGFTGGCQVGFY